MLRRTWIARSVGTAAALITSGAAPAAWAQPDYPKPGSTLRYVVPFPPGGLTDVMARSVGQQLGTRWGVTVAIDNKGGGGGQIGADAVAKSAGDGQTLLAITLTHAANVSLYKGRAPYDLLRDFKPVALLASAPLLVVVPAASPIKDFKDLQLQARKRPLNAGSSGNGTPAHLTLALFNQANQSEVQHVPYKGGAPSLADLIGGQLDVVFSNLPESIAHVKAGKLRALAVTSRERHPLLPEVPTTAEAGLPALLAGNWTGILVPASTPDAVVAKLGQEAVAIANGADFAEQARQQGFRIDARGPREFGAFLKDEVDRWAGIVTSARIQAD